MLADWSCGDRPKARSHAHPSADVEIFADIGAGRAPYRGAGGHDVASCGDHLGGAHEAHHLLGQRVQRNGGGRGAQRGQPSGPAGLGECVGDERIDRPGHRGGRPAPLDERDHLDIGRLALAHHQPAGVGHWRGRTDRSHQ